MIKGASRLWTAGFVAGAAFLCAAPYIHYAWTYGAERARLRAGLTVEDALATDLVATAFMAAIASVVGTFRSERYALGGLRTTGATTRVFAVLVLCGVFLSFVFYATLGRVLQGLPLPSYPKEWLWATVVIMKGAVFEEVVRRFGMMTIVAGVTPRLWIANVLQAGFFTIVDARGANFWLAGTSLGALWAPVVLVALFGHLAAGALYQRYGLVAACTFHLALHVDRWLHVFLTTFKK